MKKLFLSLALISTVFSASAQSLQPDVQALKDACLSLRAAISAGDIDGLRSANKAFKNVKTANFGSLRPVQPSTFPSLNGHFIFEPEFVDSLITLGKGNVYKYADKYTQNGAAYRCTASNGIFIKNVLLKENSASIYTINAYGHMELVFVTEPGGLISVTVYDKKHDVYYKEHNKEMEGASFRIHTFDLPHGENVELQITIQNISKNDVSCILMSN